MIKIYNQEVKVVGSAEILHAETIVLLFSLKKEDEQLFDSIIEIVTDEEQYQKFLTLNTDDLLEDTEQSSARLSEGTNDA